MRFTGQVRVPEVDHPGVPATIVVDEGQTEVFLEGESLGRWSLFDVHASRLVSSAFSISLAGEEITFIADEPVDFAYKGVDHMAGVWARYKSMTIPRRVVAVGRSRRGTIPSRISELREAMLHNLESAGRGTARLVPMDRASETLPEPASWTKRIDAYSNVPQPLDIENRPGAVVPAVTPIVETVASDDPEPVAEPEPVGESPVDEVPIVAEAALEAPPAPSTAPLRPGPGLIPRRIEQSASIAEPDQVFAPPVEQFSIDETKWDEPPPEDEPLYDEVPTDADTVYFDEVQVPDPTLGPLIEPQPEVTADGPAEVTAGVTSEVLSEAETQVEPGGAASMPGVSVPDEKLSTDADEGETARRELVLDLGHLEEGDHGGAVADDEEQGGKPEPSEPDLELLFAGAPAPASERSGLMGTVRSAFARNRVAHEHEFVEAPGGIGIVRQICAECGYISIGVSD